MTKVPCRSGLAGVVAVSTVPAHYTTFVKIYLLNFSSEDLKVIP
jgi:hypothetical protein